MGMYRGPKLKHFSGSLFVARLNNPLNSSLMGRSLDHWKVIFMRDLHLRHLDLLTAYR